MRAKRKETGGCEGRKSAIEGSPQLFNEARHLRRKNRATGKRMSYDRVAKKLFEMGFAAEHGTLLKRQDIDRILGNQSLGSAEKQLAN